MSDLVRVRLNGREKNVGRAFAEFHGLEVLDEPTTNPDGTPRGTTRQDGRPVKPKTTVEQAAEQKAVTQSASTPQSKETDK